MLKSSQWETNDGTYNKSVKEGIGAKLKKTEVKQFGVYNPFEQMAKNGESTLFHRDGRVIFLTKLWFQKH